LRRERTYSHSRHRSRVAQSDRSAALSLSRVAAVATLADADDQRGSLAVFVAIATARYSRWSLD